MDKSQLRKLAGLPAIKEAWTAGVDTKKHPPEGLFASGTSKSILKWIKANHTDLKSAMSSLNFYINRSGKNLTAARKAELEQIKTDIRSEYSVKESDMSLLRRMAGLPLREADLSDIDDDQHKPEEDDAGEQETDYEDQTKTGDATGTEDLPEIVKQIAAEAEGKTGEDMEELIHKIYQAGFTDGKADIKNDDSATTDEEPKTTNEHYAKRKFKL